MQMTAGHQLLMKLHVHKKVAAKELTVWCANQALISPISSRGAPGARHASGGPAGARLSSVASVA
jgi:hypothetical protein